MTIYYKVIKTWCKFPFQNLVDTKSVEFYEKIKGTFVQIHSLKIDSNTSIKEKEDYVKRELNLQKVEIKKINH